MKNKLDFMKQTSVAVLFACAAASCNNSTPAEDKFECPKSFSDTTFFVAQEIKLEDSSTGRASMKRYDRIWCMSGKSAWAWLGG